MALVTSFEMGTSSAMPCDRAGLLGLPLELRLQIYRICFDRWQPHPSDQFSNIASVCHQMRTEAIPFLLQDDHNFNSIEAFVHWTLRGPPHMLPFIKKLFCYWLMDSLLHRASNAADEPLATNDQHLEPVTSDINHELERALCSVSKLQRIFLDLALASHPFTDVPSSNKGRHEDQETVFRMLSRSCPKLQSLSIKTDIIPTNCLQGFNSLTALCWSGYSSSTPQETLSILNSLPSLHTIRLERWPESDDQRRFSVPTAQLYKYVSFTSDVLQGLKPLKRFKIGHLSSRIPADFLTVPMLKALSSHSGRLYGFDIVSDRWMEPAVVEEILNITSSFKMLEQIIIFLYSVPKKYSNFKIESRIGPSVKSCRVHFRWHEGPGQEISLKYQFG